MAGPIAPNETANAAATMLTISTGLFMSLCLFDGGVLRFADCGADEDHRENSKDVGLNGTRQQIERHQRNRHEQTRERQQDADHEHAAHYVAEQAYHER